MKWPRLERVLKRKPLQYQRHKGGGGSHRKMVSRNGYPDLYLAFHDDKTLSPGLVRDILVEQVGLSEDEALKLL
jgi:predicted RNA binding protein YcfA (HicA-like mRNA interferase family)